MNLRALIREVLDLLGQLLRRDYGRGTARNVVRQAKVVLRGTRLD